jgi:hypothetical protein
MTVTRFSGHCADIQFIFNLYQGATIPRVWTLVSNILKNKASEISLEDLEARIEPIVDDSYQRFLWPYIAANENIHIVNGKHEIGSDPEILDRTEYQDYELTLKLENLRLVASEKL